MQLQLEHIAKNYKKFAALSDFTIQLEPGIYGLLGPNGAGKSTLLNILAGVLPESSGSILVDGKDRSGMGSRYFDLIGYMPQFPKFYDNFTVEEFLCYICMLKGIPKNRWKETCEKVLGEVNLLDRKKASAGKLSGGMRQRLGLAQALLNEPALLILDEPTAGLDPMERIRFRNMISSLAKDRIIFLATHIVSDVEHIANQIIILKEGKLITAATSQELLQEMQGKVWSVRLPEKEVETYLHSGLISNAYYENQECVLKIVADGRPGELCEPAGASLEDVYLWYFGEK